MSQKQFDLVQLAVRAMKKRGLRPDFSKETSRQLEHIQAPASIPPHCEDLRSLLWCSIDNDDSMDLDQLTFAAKIKGKMTLWIAVADVDALVSKGSPIDRDAGFNTTSVYTPAVIFPMLPRKLSENLTSLNENEDRLALVVKVIIGSDGDIEEGSIFPALVHNRAKLTFHAIGDWLEGKTQVPDKVRQVKGLEQALRYQHEAAQILKARRHQLGTLTLEAPEGEAKVFPPEKIILQPPSHNFADQLIEHFMISANTVMAHRLREAQIPSLRRVVRVPKRWDRIREIAASFYHPLPKKPDSLALEQFLVERHKADPEAFPDLSLTVIKLLGRGEYIVETAREKPVGHFGLAISEYTHSTAPNRRYPDLITQRQYKALMQGKKSPYSLKELKQLAIHCTAQEDAAVKVERQMNKSAAALLLLPHIGTTYDGIITGASSKGTWVRLFDMPIEGRVVRGFQGLDVGDRVKVKLVRVDIPKGYIDFIGLNH